MATRPSRGRRASALSQTDPQEPAAPDEVTAAIRAAIRTHVPAAIRELARLAHEATSEQARVSAIAALIDRGYGDLKRGPDIDEGPQDITVRFVGPPDKP